MPDDTILVTVKNIRGAEWVERWNRQKLAYFILMSPLSPPKLQRALEVEWVPYDTNSYKWDKRSLTLAEFEAITAKWPRSEPIPFDASTCDRVQLVCITSVSRFGFGFNPADEPELFTALLELTPAILSYERFAYDFGRDVFLMRLEGPIADVFLTRVNRYSAFKRINPKLPTLLSSTNVLGLDVRFQCRHGSFEPPFQLWFEI